MYTKYLYYTIIGGFEWDNGVYYTGGLDGLKEAEDRLYIVKLFFPKATLKSIFLNKPKNERTRLSNI